MEAVGGGGVFLYQITVFYNKTQQHHFWNFILMTQCKLCTRAAAAAVAVNKDRSPMGRWGQCSIYRHRLHNRLSCKKTMGIQDGEKFDMFAGKHLAILSTLWICVAHAVTKNC